MATIKSPYGAAGSITVEVTGTTAVTLTNFITITNLPTLTGNATLDVTASAELVAGSKLLVTMKTTGTETFTFTGAIVAPVVTGSAGKTWSQNFIFNGTKYYPAGAKIQVD